MLFKKIFINLTFKLLITQDGKPIADERRVGRWELQVPRLGADDAGVYVCRAVNPLGSINASFIIQVVGK